MPLPDVLPGPRSTVSPPERPRTRRILVADEDPNVVEFVIHTLRRDGHSVFHAYDALSAVELAVSLKACDLVISNTRVAGATGIDLIHHLRRSLPTIPFLYMATPGRSTPELEANLPPGTPILREPFTADELRVAVGNLLNHDGNHDGHRSPDGGSDGSGGRV